ncbi:MAG: GPW/gp25 family protein [bacterium]
MGNSEFLGTGWGFPPQFYNNGKDIQLVSDADDIKESLEIIFSTAIQERLYYPDFGCDLKKFMFEEINNALVIEIQQMILDAIYLYEPRIDVQKIEITESEEEAHLLLINIDYTVKTINSAQNIVYPLYLY